jgi:hypothetical protein
MSVADSHLDKLKAALLDIRHTSYQSRTEGRWRWEADQQRSGVKTLRSEGMFIHMQMKRNYCIRHLHELSCCGYESNTEQNACFISTGGSLRTSSFFRVHTILGDTMNIPLCGRMPMYSPAMCFHSLSAFTVKYLFQLLTVIACYITQGMSVCVYHYTRDATASFRGKLWISNMICVSIINADILSLQIRICNLTKYFLVHDFPLKPGGNEQHFSFHSSLVLQFLGKRFKPFTCLFHLLNS